MPDRSARFAACATLLAGLAAALPSALQAQDRRALDTVPHYRLEGVTVTVGRAETERDALPRRIEVVTRSDIERTAASDAAELLKKRATADVIEYPGLLAGVGLRGFRPQFFGINQRTLVLIDGRPAGASNLALLDLRGIERVEVMKGPASALYGSNAMGGVVNLVPRRGAGPLRSSASFGYGSWETRQASLSTGGSLSPGADFDLSLATFDQGSDYRVGGGNFFRDRLGDSVAVRVFADSTSLSPELGSGEIRPHTQYGTRSGSARLGVKLDDGWRLDVRGEGLRAERVQNPGDLFSAWGDNRSLKDVARSSADVALSRTSGGHALTLRAFTAREDGENYNHAEAETSVPQFIDLRTGLRWRGVQLTDAIAFGAHTLVAGIDYLRARSLSERFDSPEQRAAPYEPDSQLRSRAAFAEARLRSADGRFVATLGGRLDDIAVQVHATELFEFEPGAEQLAASNRESFIVLNPSAGMQYTAGQRLRLHGSAGRAFVTPSAFNVAARVERRGADGTLHLTTGNPELKPESSVSWDAGAGVFDPARGVDVDVTYFRTRVRDRIVSRTTSPGSLTTPQGEAVATVTTYHNADEAEMRGLEWRLAYDFGARAASRYVLRPFVSAAHLRHAEETLGTQRRRIRNVADHTVNYGIDFDDLRRFHTRLSGRYVGERVDDDWNVWPAAEVHYPPFMTLDWTGELRLAERFRLGVQVSNLTDENYYEVRGYPLAGRAAQVRLSVDF